jgi:hypothetical protein
VAGDDRRGHRPLDAIDRVDRPHDLLRDAEQIGTLHRREDVPRTHDRDRRANATHVLEPGDHVLDRARSNPQVHERVH